MTAPRLLAFANNVEATVAADVGDFDTVITLDTEQADAIPRPQTAVPPVKLLATITSSAKPGAMEIVEITARTGAALTVVRSVDDSVRSDWPAGSMISLRVTAGMLSSFMQSVPSALETSDPVFTSGKDNLIFGLPMPEDGSPPMTAAAAGAGNMVFRGRTNLWSSVMLSGYHVLPITTAFIGEQFAPGEQDMNMGLASMGGSSPVDLGVPKVWQPSSYFRDGSVVTPPTANGKQYFVETPNLSGLGLSGESEPNWLGAAVEPSGTRWRPTVMPVDMTLDLWYYLSVTEVGFICHFQDATVAPVISIGIDGDPTRFVDHQQLTGAGSEPYMFRFPITASGALIKSIRYQLNTPAAGGQFVGRFYWRGNFIDTWMPE